MTAPASPDKVPAQVVNSVLPAEPLSLSDRASDARLFVGTLFPFKMNAYVELRTFSDKPPYRRWDHVLDASYLNYESLLSKLETSHTYIGMAARRVHGAGDRENCYAIPAVFIDGDFKTVGQINQFAAALKTFPLQPTMVVRSGSGLECSPIGLRTVGT
jgi:hypothetical protein